MTPPIPPLRIRVRLFAMQRAAAGMRELRLEVPLGSTVDDAWNAVVDTVPALAPGRSSLRFAVNGEYADEDLTLADELATDEDGGIVTFTGRTRVTPGTPAPGQEAEAARHAGRVVEELDYEAFEPMAVRDLDQIADEIEERFGVRRVAIVHRTGVVPLGESSIVVVAVAPHRDAAFTAARYAIDETKARAPIWKAERFEDGVVWIGDAARRSATDPG